jgi:hypothetical protein
MESINFHNNEAAGVSSMHNTHCLRVNEAVTAPSSLL